MILIANYMKKPTLLIRGFLHALAVVAYVCLLATFFSRANSWFGQADREIFSPVAAMLMFIFSALVTGGLVLGKPIMLYVDGQKKEGVKLLFFTGLCLLFFTVLAFLILALLNK